MLAMHWASNMLATAYSFDWSVVPRFLPDLLRGVVITLEVSALSQLVAVVAGFVLALARMSKIAPVRLLATVYIDFLRSIPILVILLWVYYGVSILFGVSFSALQAAVFGLGASYAAYLAEIFRSGIQAVPMGQREAGRTLGLSNRQIMSVIVVPQALRVIVPPFGNTVISMLKDSSLVSVLAVDELLRRTQEIAATTFRPFELYAAVAVLYYVMTLVAARATNMVERRLDPGTRRRGRRTLLGLAPAPASAGPNPLGAAATGRPTSAPTDLHD